MPLYPNTVNKNDPEEIKRRKRAVVFAESPWEGEIGNSSRKQAFVQEAENLKRFYSKNHPETDFSIVPFYGQEEKELLSKNLDGFTDEDEVFMFGHSGGQIGGLEHKDVANTLQEKGVKNCYMGSCSFEKYSDPYKKIQNFHYRPDMSWYGVNDKAKDLTSAMYSKSYTNSATDHWGAGVVEPQEGKEYIKTFHRPDPQVPVNTVNRNFSEVNNQPLRQSKSSIYPKK